jgi:stearoyl-CoA desaturase (delta-9 desaturase)
LVWAFSISSVLVYHATFAVNSIGHRMGRRPFETRDDSRNNWAVALVTLGEGWHNNHHRVPGSARARFARWEIDPTWIALRALAAARITGGLRPVPAGALFAARASRRLPRVPPPEGANP